MNESVDINLLSYEEGIEKSIEYFISELNVIRVGRANPKILDKVVVDYYGTMTPINQMATISVPEARMIIVSAWDISMVKAMSKAIEAANLGLNPSDDGRSIRLIFPQLTEERRKELCKEVSKLCEQTKVTCRNARRDIRKTEILHEIKAEDLSQSDCHIAVA